jgi:hypothetical protein
MLSKSLTQTLCVLLLGTSLFMTGCFTHQHVIGTGAQTGAQVEAKQWYALWGLVPINTVDTNQMAAGANNYTITTQTSFIDAVIGIFTGIVTIYPRTVAVQR